MIIALFVLPLIVYIIAYFYLPKYRPATALFGSIAIALISLLTMYFLVSYGVESERSKRIVWTGLKSKSQELTVGGNSETSFVGWSNGSFAPKVKAVLKDSRVEMEISGGGGFVVAGKTKEYLNGIVLRQSEPKTFEGYTFTPDYGFLSSLVKITKDNTILAEISLPRKDSVVNLDGLIERNTREMTPQDEETIGWTEYFLSWFRANEKKLTPKERYDAIENLKLWAQNVRLVVQDSGEARFLLTESANPDEALARYTCDLPCTFSVRWSNSKISAKIDQLPKDKSLVLQYLPPFRNSSPMPPKEAGEKIIVSNQVLPDEYVFPLPLGNLEKLENQNELGRTWVGLDLKPVSETQKKTGESPVFTPKDTQSLCKDLVENVEAQANCKSVSGQNTDFIFSIIQDAPPVGTIFWLSLLAFLVFVAGLVLNFQLLKPKNGRTFVIEQGWAIFGLAATVWNFLVFQLILAIRYALDPAYLDGRAISGVTMALIGLAFMPGFLLLVTRLQRDARLNLSEIQSIDGKKYCLFFLVFLLLVLCVEYYFSGKMWANMPVESGDSRKLLVVCLAIGLYLFVHILAFYRFKLAKNNHRLSPALRSLKFLLIDIWDKPRRFLPKLRGFWHSSLSEKTLSARWLGRFLVICLSLLVFSVFLRMIGVSPFIERLSTQIIYPLLGCGLVLLFWLSAKTVPIGDKENPKSAGVKQNWKTFGKIVLVAFLTIGSTLFGILILRDAGSIYVFLAIFLSLFFILFKSSAETQSFPKLKSFNDLRLFARRFAEKRIFGLAVGSVIAVGLIVAVYIFFNFYQFAGVASYLGKTTPRILVFKEGSDFQHHLLSSDVGSEGNEIGLNDYDVINTYQHLWENKAIAHEAGWLGFGYGKAPVRLSQVPQGVIQFDSVFSFYILGDYGLIGGFFLLLLYFIPLILIYIVGRLRFDVGFAIAIIIASVFLLEGLAQAAMNLWVLPFTGRNLPLLSVNSPSADFLRWLVFFAVAINVMFWRYKEDAKINEQEASIFGKPFSNEAAKTEQTDESAPTGKKTDWKNLLLSWSETRRQILLLIMIPALLLVLIIFAGIPLWYGNDKDSTVLTWDKIRENIEFAISNEIVTVSQEEGKTVPCPKLNFIKENYDLKGRGENERSFLNQQINRFNALACADRIGSGTLADSLKNAGEASVYQSYQNYINQLRETDQPARRISRPNLFTVRKIRRQPFETETGAEETRFIVKFNPEFNIHRSFKEESNQKEFLNISFAGGDKLTGSAWVKGKWIAAYNPDPRLLSWTEFIPASVNPLVKNEDDRAFYKELSLDQKLHTSALAFIDRKGIELQKQKLSKSFAENPDLEDRILPRIGLTVLRLSKGADNGAVLGLGSFPRTTSGNQWQKLCYRRDKAEDCLWLPPAKTVEKRFPQTLKNAYDNDQNFETAAVMGSTTKPMWATAVLKVHRNLNLDKTFKVSGTPVNDTTIFGIKTGNVPWHGHGSRFPLVDFKNFLTESNNRYQVLFSFLGLAEADANGILSVPAMGNTKLETFSNFNRQPKFPEDISFSRNKPQEIRNLHLTTLAAELRALYGTGTFQKEDLNQVEDFSPYMNSFWTKNESDDALRRFDDKDPAVNLNSAAREALAPVILPVRANFKLNKLKTPREFVSALLGGADNRWSNVHVAAGFGSVVLGQPVLPHIVKNDAMPVSYGRDKNFIPIAKLLRPGLQGVVFAENGTARGKLSKEAREFLQSLKNSGYEIYAKTGTLDDGGGTTSRLLLAIVQFEDNDQTVVKNGMVFSLFIEETELGKATVWLGDFLNENRTDISRLLGR